MNGPPYLRSRSQESEKIIFTIVGRKFDILMPGLDPSVVQVGMFIYLRPALGRRSQPILGEVRSVTYPEHTSIKYLLTIRNIENNEMHSLVFGGDSEAAEDDYAYLAVELLP